MTVLKSLELTCPVCGTQFETQTVVSTNSFGGERTDFHERAAGPQPLPFKVHTCTHCAYSGDEEDFSATVDEDVRAHVWIELAPTLKTRARLTGSERYEFAAKVAEWRGERPEVVADVWLRAAWCAVDEGDTEAERYYRLRSAAWFETACDPFSGVNPEQRLTYTYLVGELWRRIGDVRKARDWFERVKDRHAEYDATVDKAADHYEHGRKDMRWVVDLADQQAMTPREWLS